MISFYLGSYKDTLSFLSVLLCHRFPKVRVTTANQLYIALMTYCDVVFPNDEDSEEALRLLSETDWNSPVTELRVIRNQFCDAVGIKPPQLKSASAKS